VDLPAAGIPDTKPGPNGTPLVVTFYSLRHSAGLLAEQGGATLREVMALMRHSDPKLTLKTYGRLQSAQLGQTVERMPCVVPHVEKHVGPGGNGRESVRTVEKTTEGSVSSPDRSEPLDLKAIEHQREVLSMIESSSPGRIRTYDPPVNSRLLYR
jgi:hypothetical protein